MGLKDVAARNLVLFKNKHSFCFPPRKCLHYFQSFSQKNCGQKIVEIAQICAIF